MKLVTKLTSSYLLIAGFVFILGGFITFEIIESEIKSEQMWELRKATTYISDRIKLGINPALLVSSKIQIVALPQNAMEQPIHFRDTLVWVENLQKLEPHEKAISQKRINGQVYQISVYNVLLEEDEISKTAISSLSLTFLILLTLFGLTSLILSRIFLKPLHQTLKTIEEFDLTQVGVPFASSNTKEFDQLNQFLNNMSQKAKQEYQSLKSFSENASHEMQTPLAIAKGKLELLLNTTLNENQTELIQSSYLAIDRLSRLNKTLLLLTKLDNHEFQTAKKINFSKLLNETLLDYKEIIDFKNMQLTANIQADIEFPIDPSLAYILITNLLNNAIKHNLPESGQIAIELTSASLKIKNTGLELAVPPQELFKRFKKANQSSSSIGLGLSIIKSICNKNAMTVAYTLDQNWHQIEISFLNKSSNFLQISN